MIPQGDEITINNTIRKYGVQINFYNIENMLNNNIKLKLIRFKTKSLLTFTKQILIISTKIT